jgi:hypothetical protein
MNDPNDPVQRRATFLPMFLAVAGGGFACLLLVLLTGGFFFYFGLVVLGLTGLGLFHYMVWGRAMSEQTAGEREEMELLEKAKEQVKKGPGPMFRR